MARNDPRLDPRTPAGAAQQLVDEVIDEAQRRGYSAVKTVEGAYVMPSVAVGASVVAAARSVVGRAAPSDAMQYGKIIIEPSHQRGVVLRAAYPNVLPDLESPGLRWCVENDAHGGRPWTWAAALTPPGTPAPQGTAVDIVLAHLEKAWTTAS